jgi:hypothetical protein
MRVVLMSVPAAAAAQSATVGLVVMVTDTTGGVLVGATCELRGDSGTPRVAVVESDGRCRFTGLVPGAYRLTVGLSGFEPRIVTIEADAERVAETAVTLRPALSEQIVVSAARVPTPVSALPNTVTILDQSIIERRTASSDDLASVLEANVPGFGPSLKKLAGGGESCADGIRLTRSMESPGTHPCETASETVTQSIWTLAGLPSPPSRAGRRTRTRRPHRKGCANDPRGNNAIGRSSSSEPSPTRLIRSGGWRSMKTASGPAATCGSRW